MVFLLRESSRRQRFQFSFVSTASTSTQPPTTTTAATTASPVNSDFAAMKSQLAALKSVMSNIENQTAVADLLNRADSLSRLIDTLELGLPYTLDAVAPTNTSLQNLQKDFTSFLLNYYGELNDLL
jgi:hypothetical protein